MLQLHPQTPVTAEWAGQLQPAMAMVKGGFEWIIVHIRDVCIIWVVPIDLESSSIILF